MAFLSRKRRIKTQSIEFYICLYSMFVYLQTCYKLSNEMLELGLGVNVYDTNND